MNVNIVSVDIEVKKPGARGWSLANVKYTKDGETKWQNVASFKAPAVFKQLESLVGETADVTVGQNDKGYDEWTAIKLADANGASATAPTAPANTGATRVTGSNFETPVERAKRQVLIVRQSSLSNAVEVINKFADQQPNPHDYLNLAQIFVDWVFDEEVDESEH